ncbi:MAG: amino acid racemase [Acidimicrobiales bacterium]
MRTIGLLGGMSWVSTEHYYRLINSDVAERLGGEHCAALTLWQSDFAHLAELQRTGRWDVAGDLLASGATSLVAAGAEVIAICANTMHLVADAVQDAIGERQLVHIVDVLRDECLRRGVGTLGLLGTAYTMESPDLFPPKLAAADIGVLTPDADDRALVQRITFEELVRDVVSDESRAAFRRIATSMIDAGADGIALACTEHGLLLGDGDLPVPVLDSAALHATAIVDAALAA